MTIQSYSVLRHLKRLSNNTEIELCFLGDTTFICPTWHEETTYDFSKYKSEIYSIMDDLVHAGYLVYSKGNKYFFKLTSKGIHPLQGIYFQIINFLFRSVFVPIGVSALTSIILLSIDHWLMH